MKNLTCSDQQSLLILLEMTKVKTEEVSYERLGSCASKTFFRVWGKSTRPLE